MAQKTNIRSIRFSDEFAELIERQQGKTFSEKLENLVTRCCFELPEKEKLIAAEDRLLKEKRRELSLLSEKTYRLSSTLSDLQRKTDLLKAAIDFAVMAHIDNDM